MSKFINGIIFIIFGAINIYFGYMLENSLKYKLEDIAHQILKGNHNNFTLYIAGLGIISIIIGLINIKSSFKIKKYYKKDTAKIQASKKISNTDYAIKADEILIKSKEYNK